MCFWHPSLGCFVLARTSNLPGRLWPPYPSQRTAIPFTAATLTFVNVEYSVPVPPVRFQSPRHES